MAHVNKVLRSIETPDGGRCVDLFVRPDGTFGFEEYRRDEEDGRGWFPVGFFADAVFRTPDGALDAARDAVSWLAAGLDAARRLSQPSSPAHSRSRRG